MSLYYDDLETRSAAERAADLPLALAEALANAKRAPTLARSLREVEPEDVRSMADLARLPVLRKSDLVEAQARRPPLGGYATRHAHEFDHLFQSPGPIYEPGRLDSDWWRMGRFLTAAGIVKSDVVQNCFSYHLTPAGQMFDSGARAVGAAVFPAGTGQTELQLRAAADLGTTVYAGTPDYLKVLLDKAGEQGLRLGITRAVVGGGALFPSLRALYAEAGIATFQCYATADLGLIAYESEQPEGGAGEGMIVDERVIVEIVRPGTGDPVPEGEVGEVLVTTLNPDYPLIRFATGDLSAVLAGTSACGRTGLRINGWMGRADQTTKIKGMFVRPEQVAALIARHPEVARARVIADRAGEADVMTVQLETRAADPALYEGSVLEALKLKGRVEIVPPGSLPNDGRVIEDRRRYD
ncbi:phenylacetate--CoA ligase family protein [Paracoccus suum]|uniref:Phenylacetate--CoA ligase family protein n=1 Tax=Paracoccus suum TaxID=2259340 RepID=A0A344PHV7_9RHOB|nr:AMP-binding protein [Paracoccus suum]AXC48962.1 phenylacetate--CoA ligase family protein [Paracoccus suum]